MEATAAVLTIIAAFLVGFLHLSWFWLLPLAALAVLGLRHFETALFATRLAYAKLFAAVLLFLFVLGWVAWLASDYLSGQASIGSVG
jgi:hypothetical protein